MTHRRIHRFRFHDGRHASSCHPLVVALWGFILLVGLSTAARAGDEPPVRVYPAAPQEPLSGRYAVQVENREVPVYLATILAMTPERRVQTDLQHFEAGDLGQTSFASFDLRGAAQVTVTCPRSINGLKLLPSSSGITPRVTGCRATFTLSKPGQFVLEVNGDTVGSLQLFANPWEDHVPNPNDPNVIYYGPGIHKVTGVKVSSGQTVYAAADAVIYGVPGSPGGSVFDLHGDNIAFRGRGILDGSLCPHGTRSLLAAEGRNISIEGIILRDSGSWTMPMTGCDKLTIANVKIFGFRGNSDGIDLNGTRDAEVSDCYVRTGDDLIVVKTQIPGRGPSRHIAVEHCVLWNEFAHALSLGAEIREPIDDIRFSDCDIIHDQGREWLLRIYQCDAAPVSNVAFQNIRIEECRKLISLWIGSALWSKDLDRGHLDEITFQDIESPIPSQPHAPVELVGIDADHAIHGVKLDHLIVAGRRLTRDDVKQNDFVAGVVVTP